jgi:hypothetical protein
MAQMSGQDSHLSDVDRWYATEGDGVPWVVIQAEGEDGRGMHHAIAECGTQATAEMIARALNSRGAVPADDTAIGRMVELLSRYGWALEVREALVRDLLDAARGGQ